MSDTGNFEVELKFELTQRREVITDQLRAMGAVSHGEIQQADFYFNHPVRDFAETDEALRIRQVGDSNCITWKGPRLDSATKTRREIEVELGQGSATSAQFATVLEVLGFRPVACVRKRRQQFSVAWSGHTLELALDEVESVGTFLEIELLAAESKVELAQEIVLGLARHLDLAEPESRSYLELLLATSA